MARKIKKQTTGGWVDESIDSKALAVLPVDAATRERIAALLGDYRLVSKFRDTAPTPAESVEHIKKVRRSIASLLELLDLIPDGFKAAATNLLLELNNEGYEQFSKRLKSDLVRFQVVSAPAIRALERQKLKGETPKYLEHKLLAGVAELLEPYCKGKKEAAAGDAAHFLRAAGVPWMPISAKRARADVLAYLKKQ